MAHHSLGRNCLPGRLLLDAASAPLGRRLLGLVAALGLRGQALLAPSSKEGSKQALCSASSSSSTVSISLVPSFLHYEEVLLRQVVHCLTCDI